MRALLALVLLLAGCSLPRAKVEQGRSLTERATVCWVEPAPSLERKAAVLAGLNDAARVYRAAFGEVEVGMLFLYPRGKLPLPTWELVPGAKEGGGLIGLTQSFQRGRPWIHLPIGKGLGAIVHELHHCRIGDPFHLDETWREVDWIGAQVEAGR